MSVRMRHTSGHTKNRRSHHALKEPRLSRCDKCNALHLRHRMCTNCGTYKGREVIDVMSKIIKKQEKRTKKQEMKKGVSEKTEAKEKKTKEKEEKKKK